MIEAPTLSSAYPLTASDQSPLANGLANRRDPLAFYRSLATNLGNFVQYELPTGAACFVNEPALVQNVLIKEDARLSKWSFYPSWPTVVGQGILGSEGPLHKQMRRVARPAFQPRRLSEYTTEMVDLTMARMQTWADGEVLDLRHQLVLLTLDIAAQTLFGVALGDRLERMYEATRTAQRLSDRMGRAPADEQLFEEAIAEIEEVSRFVLTERRRTGQSDADLLSLLLAGQEEFPEVITDEQISLEIRTFLLAGHVATANVLAAACWHLSRDPEASAALRATLDEALGGRLPTLADIPKLKSCEHILLEALRMYPPIWLLGRQVEEEITLGGHVMPVGTRLAVVPWVLHRDPVRYPEPDQFLPSRWENDARANLPRGAFLPFSAGSRGCLGEHFAMLEGVLLLACLASQWNFQEAPGQPEPGWSPQIILWPRRGVHLRASRRSV